MWKAPHTFLVYSFFTNVVQGKGMYKEEEQLYSSVSISQVEYVILIQAKALIENHIELIHQPFKNNKARLVVFCKHNVTPVDNVAMGDLCLQ